MFASRLTRYAKTASKDKDEFRQVQYTNLVGGDEVYTCLIDRQNADVDDSDLSDDDTYSNTRMALEIEHLKNLAQVRTKRLIEMQNLGNSWNNKVASLENLVSTLEEEVGHRKEALQVWLHEPEDEFVPPGPECAQFVVSTSFSNFASLVIVANMVTLVLELLHDEYEQILASVEQVFLMFYVFELLAKATLLQSHLLCGDKLAEVLWNWVDTIVVVAGVVELWLWPWLVAGESSSLGNAFSSLRTARLLRMARFTRILKIVKVFLKSDFRWVMEKNFNTFLLVMFFLNCVMIGLECDYDWVMWPYLETAFLVVFVFELLVRLKLVGIRYCFRNEFWWTTVDVIIVLGGVLDVWMIPLLRVACKSLGKDEQMADNASTILKPARLLRVMRAARLVKAIPALYSLLAGIYRAMMGMFWVLMLMLVFLYLTAILSVKLISDGVVFGGNAPQEVKDAFPSASRAFFVLFTLVGGDRSSIEPVIQAVPETAPIVMLFTITCSWSILSVLTAVVSENMMRAAEEQREAGELLDKRNQAEESRNKLMELFDQADTNDNLSLTKDEFEEIILDPASLELLREATGLTQLDLKDLFTYLSSPDDVTGEQIIGKDAFLDGLQNENRPISERSIMRLESRLAEVERFLPQPIKENQAVTDDNAITDDNASDEED
eukprot:TRINITY_DN9083_c0_g1_i1.p1 TRINITY_DN9083_c0_g1~~TRINITY_DN9083_c0_g1_i1.p1  ORF type:complete len:695 (-),score=159.56 TRINITY_DN9083_c0_g1_i1:138-2129(-)